MERVRVTRLGHLGDGVGDTDAGPVFAPFVLPGETARGALVDGRLTLAAIEDPSLDRVAPPCPHFGLCGGCALQHAADGFLADWKTALIRDALAARGLDAPIRPIHVSPPGARRRAALSGRRTKKTVILGFHERADAAIAPIETCAVLRPEIVAAFPALRALFGLVCSRQGEGRASVTVSAAGLDVALDGAKPLDGPLRARLAEAAAAADLARLSYGDETVAARRPPAQRFGRASVVPPPGGFLQATADGEAALGAAVREAAGEARRIVDLFAGCGTFALPLAERAEVRAVEGDAAMAAALDLGRRRAEGLRAVTVETRDLFRRPLLAPELEGVDAVVIDPPRAGAAAQTAELARSRVARVAAVSCNPATFARDARTLVDGGFRLLWVQPVDQFRWSPHVELAAAFARA
jgi:23S rRNA (uracil1939-C5)-methyltransferase